MIETAFSAAEPVEHALEPSFSLPASIIQDTSAVIPIQSTSHVSPFVLISLSALMVLLSTALICSLFGFNSTLARIVHLFRFVTPRQVAAVTTSSHSNPLPEESAPVPAIFDVVDPPGMCLALHN